MNGKTCEDVVLRLKDGVTEVAFTVTSSKSIAGGLAVMRAERVGGRVASEQHTIFSNSESLERYLLADRFYWRHSGFFTELQKRSEILMEAVNSENE